ncbi:zinc-finger double domain-containing protein [Phthorimaea operculella]|nr:zinc-finger double domain-containing protein [Phthorimaea operculella]
MNYKIEVLNRDNYESWKIQCRALLVKNGYWAYVSGTEKRPEGDEVSKQENVVIKNPDLETEKKFFEFEIPARVSNNEEQPEMPGVEVPAEDEGHEIRQDHPAEENCANSPEQSNDEQYIMSDQERNTPERINPSNEDNQNEIILKRAPGRPKILRTGNVGRPRKVYRMVEVEERPITDAQGSSESEVDTFTDCNDFAGTAQISLEDAMKSEDWKGWEDAILSEDKVKKAKKIVKRIKTENKLPKVKKEDEQKILTIELTYEEMLLEREKESKRDSYLKSEYKCESCLIGFNYAKSYESHVKNKHSLELGNYSCPICKTIIASVESFTSHYKRHMRRYECSICHKRTMDVKVMQQHYYSIHEIQLKKYTCNICGKVSNSIDTHRYHRDTHKARIECKECDKTFSHRAGLLNHRLTVHELHSDFPCEVCGKTFRWKTSLKRHLDKHDESKYKNGIPAAVCEPCNIEFQSVSSYQRHLRNSLKHVSQNELSSYQRHLRNSLKHVSQNELRFICDPCGKRFADKTKLRDHIEEKHLHKTYQCHICNKPSKNRVGLDQHIRNVHKGRPNNKVCHYCGKAFPTKVQLESHIRSHTGERPYVCTLCPTTFSQQSNLYKHNRQVHLNIKSKRYPPTKKRKEAPEPSAEPYRPMLYLTDTNFIS